MKRILVATDGSRHAKNALTVAEDLAAANGGRLLLLHVLLSGKEVEEIETLPERAGLAAEADEALRAALREAPEEKSVAEVLADPAAPLHPAPRTVLEAIGDAVLNAAVADVTSRGIVVEKLPAADSEPAEAILKAAREQEATAVVMGCRGVGDLEAFTFGSVSREVAQKSPCSVIMVHAAAN